LTRDCTDCTDDICDTILLFSDSCHPCNPWFQSPIRCHGAAEIRGSGSDVAEGHGLPQSVERVAGGDELLADMALVADLDERLHDRPVVDLLLVVELAPAGVAGRVDVRDEVLVLAEAAGYVAVP